MSVNYLFPPNPNLNVQKNLNENAFYMYLEEGNLFIGITSKFLNIANFV
jgi:hypothetical protein